MHGCVRDLDDESELEDLVEDDSMSSIASRGPHSRIPNDARSSIVEQCGEPLGFRTCRSEPPAFQAWKAPLTSQLLRAVASERVGFSKGLRGGDCRGALGLSGAKKPTSNAQAVGRQRAPRAAEFVSKNPKPYIGVGTY